MGLESATYISQLNSANPVATDLKSAGDDHIRMIKATLQATFPGMAGRMSRAAAKSANYTAVLADNTTIFNFTAGANLYLTAAATLGNGWTCAVYGEGGDVVIDPNGSETVNNATTLTIPQDYLGIIWCTGTEFFCAVLPGVEIKSTLANKIAAGLHTIWIPASAMVPQITDGAASDFTELATNDVMQSALAFDSTIAEYAQFALRMPKSWNEGTIKYAALWRHGSTTTNFGVVWSLQATAVSDGDALDASWGTGVTVADTGGTTDTLYATAQSGSVTIGGTPVAEDLVNFRVSRVPGDASDTMAIDAKLLGVAVYLTLTAENDA